MRTHTHSFHTSFVFGHVAIISTSISCSYWVPNSSRVQCLQRVKNKTNLWPTIHPITFFMCSVMQVFHSMSFLRFDLTTYYVKAEKIYYFSQMLMFERFFFAASILLFVCTLQQKIKCRSYYMGRPDKRDWFRNETLLFEANSQQFCELSETNKNEKSTVQKKNDSTNDDWRDQTTFYNRVHFYDLFQRLSKKKTSKERTTTNEQININSE